MGDGDDREEAARFAAGEAVCRRCGRCCHHKVRFGDIVVITDVPCEFLDPETNACTVYPRRFAEQPLCSTAEASVKTGALPGDCPYVGGASGYNAPFLLSEHPEYEQAVNALFPERVAADKPRKPDRQRKK